ncbi:MAG TPA: transglutaminase family protein [Ktedonobacteraceae bacterium]|nr:transglutaminase family protein [Ktedonobacteraceae bacterium]
MESSNTQIATLKLLDHQGIDWQRVQRSAYLIHQHFSYSYPGPVSDLHQRLLILPPDHYGDQRYIVHRLDVSAEVAETTHASDEFGNHVIELLIPRVEQSIDFEVWIVVERSAEHGQLLLPPTALTDPRYLEPSPLTQPDDALRTMAAALAAEIDPRDRPQELARRINEKAHETLKYAHDVTSIHTTASEALALGQGVCQDYAHIMLALCRLCGLPARYVSGHLLGEGSTHAWVEALLPAPEQDIQPGQTGAAMTLALDPTHGCETSLSYLTVAVGRDYYDVAPTSGTFRAPYRGELTASKRVGPISLEYADSEGRPQGYAPTMTTQ